MKDATTTEHPKAVEAKQLAEHRRLIRAIEKDRIKLAKEKFGVQFLNIGKYTICYRVDRKNVIELSTAILHPNDRHDKITGQIVALERFAKEHRITLRIFDNLTPKEYLRFVFTLL